MMRRISIEAIPAPRIDVDVEIPEGTSPARALALAVTAALDHGFDVTYKSLVGADFHSMKVEGNLSGCDLRNANFEHARVSRTSFKGASLDGASFKASVLETVDFDTARAVELSFFEAAGREVRMVGSTMDFADFTGASLTGLNLDDANLSDADFTDCVIVDSSLQRTSLLRAKAERRLTLQRSRLDGISIANATLFDPSFDDVQAPGATLRGLSLEGGHLASVAFPQAEFEDFTANGTKVDDLVACGANLKSATFKGCLIAGMDVSRTSGIDVLITEGRVARLDATGAAVARMALIDLAAIEGSTFKDAIIDDLRIDRVSVDRCVFDGMINEGMSLHGCKVASSTFEGASLGHADLSTATFDDRRCLANAKWIEGTEVPAT